MTKRKNLSKAQLDLKQRVVNAYTKRGGFRYIPSKWDKNLWKKSTADIYDYIDNKFRNTLDAVEYYSAMVFLYKHVPNQELLVEFHKSKQWLEVAKTYQPLNDTNALNRSEDDPTETKYIEANRIKTVVPIRFIGDCNK